MRCEEVSLQGPIQEGVRARVGTSGGDLRTPRIVRRIGTFHSKHLSTTRAIGASDLLIYGAVSTLSYDRARWTSPPLSAAHASAPRFARAQRSSARSRPSGGRSHTRTPTLLTHLSTESSATCARADERRSGTLTGLRCKRTARCAPRPVPQLCTA